MRDRSVFTVPSHAATLSDVLVTDELSQRPTRVPDHELENQTLRELARRMAGEPQEVVQAVVEAALRLCGADSAGIGVREQAAEGDENYRWVALGGAYRAFVGGVMPADFSPCGLCAASRTPQLFANPGRYFTYLKGTEPSIVEGLFVPFPAESQIVGVLWIASHDDRHQFDREDVRLLTSLADFTAAAMQMFSVSAENQRLHLQAQADIQEHERAENALRQINHTLKTLIYSSPLPIVVVDANPPIVRLWNPEAERLFGWREREVLGQVIPNVPDERQAECLAYRFATAQGKTFHDMETYRRRKDGTLVDVNVLAAPLHDAESRINGILLLYTDETQRKQSAEALRESEERLSMALTAAEMGTWRADLKSGTYIRDANCNRILGIGDVVTNQPITACFSHVHPEDRGRLEEAFHRAIAEHGPYEIDVRIIRPDQTEGWIREKGRPVGSTCDGPAHMAGVMLDITERKHDEEKLWASELRYQLVVQAANDAIWDWDLATNQVMWNQGLQSRFGYTAEQVGPRVEWWVQHIHPDDRQRVLDGLHAAIDSGEEGWQDEYRFERIDGSYAHVFDRGHLVHNDRTKAFRMVGFMMDLTERKRAEQMVRSSERIYRAIGESIDYGVWVCDAAGHNIYVSDSFLRLVGMTQDECSKLGWVEVLHPDDVERTIATWQECVRDGATWDIEHRFKGVDGQWHPVLARGVPVRNELGEIVSWVGINLDISRLKQAEHALKEADRRKDEFLATLAHELRNPLAPIRNAVQVLQLKGSGTPDLRWACEVIERQMVQMTRLIDDLLDVSRISRNKLELRRERVELAAVVQAAVETSRPLIEQAEHELIVTLPSEAIYLDADLTRLAQVFLNLLNNAAKYSENGSQIALTAERDGNEVVVSVMDNGVGIPPEMLPKIFEMFTQVDHSIERSQGGLGIGLTLVKQLVEMHGGKVSAVSQGTQMGSEFIVRLPIGPERAESVPATNDEGRKPLATQPLRILVVDDNRDSAVSMGMMLEVLAQTVRIAYDGEAAIAAVDDFRPDLILLDIGLPKINGYDVCRQVRQCSGGRDIVIIALTGWGQADDKRLSAEAGFNKHLVKPIDPVALREILRDVASRKQGQQDNST